jgi:hypothetical protein
MIDNVPSKFGYDEATMSAPQGPSRSRRRAGVRGTALAGLLAVAAGGAASAGERTFDVDSCLGENCKNGRVRTVTVTDDDFIVVIDPNRCGRGRYCPTSYGAFVLENGVSARVDGYELGTLTDLQFTVYVPRAYKKLFVEEIGRRDRFASLDLEVYERRVEGELPGPVADEAQSPPPVASSTAASRAAAVVLGVERYRYAPDARFASQDAARVRDLLIGRLGLQPDRVLFRVDEQATAGEFARAFAPGGWLERVGAAGAEVVVYFAGHGLFETERGRYVLLPHDADPGLDDPGYHLDELLGRLAGLGAAQVTVLLDVGLDGRARDGRRIAGGAGAAGGDESGLPEPAAGTLLVVASDGANAALESRRQGAFTYHLLRGLEGAADADGDGEIRGDELGAYLQRGIAGNEGETVPTGRPVMRGDLSVVLPAPASRSRAHGD